MNFPSSTNLGNMIAELPDAQTWLIEISPDGGERHYSYGDLRRLSAAVARALRSRKLAPHARIGLLGRNSAEYLITFYGIMRAGYCAVPIGAKLAQETIDHILRDAAVELLYADAEFATRIPHDITHLPLAETEAWQRHLDPGELPDVAMAPGDYALVLYTSGSTGVPKGVPLTHGGYIWTLQQVAVNGGSFMSETRAPVLTAAPLSHMNALFLSQTVSAYGATLVLMRQFNAVGFLEAIARHRCSIVTCVPTMLALCAREHDTIDALDLSCVKSVAMGSAPVTESLFEQVRLMFPKASVNNGWGTTETGPGVFGPHPAGKPKPALSLGHPLPDVEVRLEGGPNADEGELYVRNGAIMPGYLNRDDETRRRLIDGWYKTGDVMRRDADGFYYFVGRADDMFVCGGENIYPGEVELLLEKHPAVAQAAVLPVPDEIKGQVPAAFIVRKPGASVTEDEIKQYALAAGPVYQYPRYVRFVDELPLSAANKIDKKQLMGMTADFRR